MSFEAFGGYTPEETQVNKTEQQITPNVDMYDEFDVPESDGVETSAEKGIGVLGNPEEDAKAGKISPEMAAWLNFMDRAA